MIQISNFARNYWISSEFYSQIWIDFSMLKRAFLRDFDFIWLYFNLISLASQLLSLILWFIWDSYWFGRTTRAWRSFATSTVNQRVFIDADWTGLLFSYILFILFILFWFISLILLIFVEILKPAVWLFLPNWGGVLHLHRIFGCLHCLA